MKGFIGCLICFRDMRVCVWRKFILIPFTTSIILRAVLYS